MKLSCGHVFSSSLFDTSVNFNVFWGQFSYYPSITLICSFLFLLDSWQEIYDDIFSDSLGFIQIEFKEFEGG